MGAQPPDGVVDGGALPKQPRLGQPDASQAHEPRARSLDLGAQLREWAGVEIDVLVFRPHPLAAVEHRRALADPCGAGGAVLGEVERRVRDAEILIHPTTALL